MRVISGSLKGRIIYGYDIDGTRPTMARVKESLFGMISDYVKNGVVLDLFAGSGNLGIEAVSNGARKCYFIDNNMNAIRVIRRNVSNLGINDSVVIRCCDYKKGLKDFYDKGIKFDVIMVDPPYKYDVIKSVIFDVLKYDLLNDGGVLVLEYQNDNLDCEYGWLKLWRFKKYSDKFVNIYKKQLTN